MPEHEITAAWTEKKDNPAGGPPRWFSYVVCSCSVRVAGSGFSYESANRACEEWWEQEHRGRNL